MPPKRKTQSREQPTLTDAFLDLSAKLSKQAREPNILAYKPHIKQELFHRSEDYIRLYIGGNRSGKSFGACAEDVWWASGTHPYQKTPPTPIRGRVVAVDLMQGVNQIILPIISRHVTPSMLINGSWEDSYSKSERVLTMANGSTIEFMSYEMETEKFAGTSRHFVHYDEEPPKHVYDECQARLVDTEGHAWISMTPVEGITWVFDKIYDPVDQAKDKEIIIPRTDLTGAVFRSPKEEVTIVEVSMNENPHLSVKAQKRFLDTLSDDDKAARSKGEFVQIGGKVFPYFGDVHIIAPIENPRAQLAGWEWYSSVDSGWNNPTAWLWHAVSPDGTVITFGEHYREKMTVEDHAAIVKAKEKAWGREPNMRTGDPAMKQTTPQSGTSVLREYANNGIYINVETVPRQREVGIVKMQQYFKIRTDTHKPTWVITEDCPEFIREMRRLRFKTYASKKMREENNKQEEVHKKDDHAFDSARYFATFLPDLAPEKITESPKVDPVQILSYDQALLRQHEASGSISWTTLETYS